MRSALVAASVLLAAAALATEPCPDGDRGCNQGPIQELGGPERCRSLKAGLARDRCLQKAAMTLGDASVCEEIADATWRVLLCLVPLAPGPETGARCEEVKRGDRVGCYSRIAYRLEDDTWCRRIDNDAGRDYCLEHVKVRADRSDPCNRFDHLAKRQDCYEERALLEGNPSLCSRVGQSNFDDHCYREASKPYLERAVREKDWSACDDPRVGRKRAECVVHLAGKLGSAEHCDSIRSEPAGAIYAERCLQVAASASNDHDLCQRITEPLKRTLCIADTATHVEQCGAAGHLRGPCLQRVSLARRDASICRLIENEQTLRDCYEKSRSEGFGRCDDVGDAAARDDCHLETAAWAGDPERCRPIEDALKQEVCRTLSDLEALDSETCRALDPAYAAPCIMRLALARRDPALCTGVGDPELEEWCRALAGAEHPATSRPW